MSVTPIGHGLRGGPYASRVAHREIQRAITIEIGDGGRGGIAFEWKR